MTEDKSGGGPFDRDHDSVPATPDELWDLAHRNRDWVANHLAASRPTTWAPSLVVLCRPDGNDPEHEEISVLAVPFNTPDEKWGVIREIGRSYYRNRKLPAAIVLTADAWHSAGPVPGKPPAEQPDRRECVAVIGQSMRQGVSVSDCLFYSRDADGVMVAEGWQDMTDVTGHESPLLRQFWIGFFEESARLVGIDIGDPLPAPAGLHVQPFNPLTGERGEPRPLNPGDDDGDADAR